MADRESEHGAELVFHGVDLDLDGRTALDHVDLRVKPGETLAVIGVNGAGKTSLLRVAAGLWRPTAGRITVDGLDRFEHDLPIRRFTAVLPPDADLQPMSIRENLRLAAEAYGVSPEDFSARADGLLRMFDLKERQHEHPRVLSRGEKKKALLAQVLVSGARLYLLDEPFTGGIDPRGVSALREVLTSLGADPGVTVVFATQILELADDVADRFAVINGGRLLAVGDRAALAEAAGLPDDATLEDSFARLASRDTDVPVREVLRTLRGQAAPATGMPAVPGDDATP